MHIAKHCTLPDNTAKIIERQTLQYHSCERALARLLGVRQQKPPGREFDPRLAPEKKLPRLSHVQSIAGSGPSYG